MVPARAAAGRRGFGAPVASLRRRLPRAPAGRPVRPGEATAGEVKRAGGGGGDGSCGRRAALGWRRRAAPARGAGDGRGDGRRHPQSCRREPVSREVIDRDGHRFERRPTSCCGDRAAGPGAGLRGRWRPATGGRPPAGSALDQCRRPGRPRPWSCCGSCAVALVRTAGPRRRGGGARPPGRSRGGRAHRSVGPTGGRASVRPVRAASPGCVCCWRTAPLTRRRGCAARPSGRAVIGRPATDARWSGHPVPPRRPLDRAGPSSSSGPPPSGSATSPT